MPSPACPSADELQAFAVGNLSGSTLGRIAEHLATCQRCEVLLPAFDGAADGLVAGLSRLNDADAPSASEPPVELVTLARQAGQAQGNGKAADVSLDCGRRYARQLAAGSCRLGKFELEAELGAGSFGHVFRARDTELDRIVALKIQRAGSLADDEEASRFHREARSAAQLKHPGIVSLYEIGETEEGVCYLVTEFIEGQTLEERLKSGPLVPRLRLGTQGCEALPRVLESVPNREAEPRGLGAQAEPGHQRRRGDFRWCAELLAQAAEALQYAHAHGVIHRDIKPSNILIDPDDRPHLMDFGLAKRATGEMSMTSDGRVMGTPAYMSPEQARGESHTVDARSDIYSLGVILYEMLTGVRPFQGERRLLVLQVLEDEPRPPRRLNEHIPRDLETICLKAMAKSPGRRYQTAQEFADDLRRFLDGKPIKARRVGIAERLWRWSRRNPLAASLLLAVCLGSAAGFWYLSYLSTYFVQATALDSTRMEIAMLEEMNAFYSELVDRVDWTKTPVTHEYIKQPNALPLPATFTIDFGQRISKAESGMQVRLYSNYPWRKNGGPSDAFEQTALDTLTERARTHDSELTYHEFTEPDGRPFLRYAKAQLMKQTCVKCHNGDKASPKRDWQEGDLAGVLVVSRPLDRDIALTRSGFRSAFLLMGVIAVLPVGFCVGFLLRARMKNRAKA